MRPYILMNGLAIWTLLVGACGESKPAKDDVSSYFPLAVGNREVFDEINVADGTILGTATKEITGTQEVDGRVAFVQVNNQTNATKIHRTFLVTEGQRVMRVRQDNLDLQGNLLGYSVYAPGFLRFCAELLEPGATLVEQHVRTEYDAAGQVTKQKNKEYTWITEAVDEEVVVPAGTFKALRIKRIDSSGTDNKTYYFVKDVGKVWEQDPIGEEKLRELVLAP